MKRPFRTGLVAGLLGPTLAGAACGSGPDSEAQKPKAAPPGAAFLASEDVAVVGRPRRAR